MKRIKFEFNGTIFEIDTNTLEITSPTAKCFQLFNRQLNRMFFRWIDNSNNQIHMTTKSRLICQAFHPVANYQQLQCDHIDNDTTNDHPDNLQWLTRKENNSKSHTRQLKSKNAKNTSHKGNVIKGIDKQGNIKYFKNGMKCAAQLNCSHVLVYNVLNPNHFAKTAKGWKLEWIDVDKASGK